MISMLELVMKVMVLWLAGLLLLFRVAASRWIWIRLGSFPGGRKDLRGGEIARRLSQGRRHVPGDSRSRARFREPCCTTRETPSCRPASAAGPIAAYRQARRYLGPDPFLEANLAYALGNQPAVRRRPLVEYVLFWQDWISYPDKFHLAAGCVGATFLLAVAVLFVRRRLLVRLALLGLALSLVLVFSAAYDWYRYQWKVHGVIVAKQTVVRKGNAESYEPALTAALDEGAEFELIERRGDWLWIRLPAIRKVGSPTKRPWCIEPRVWPPCHLGVRRLAAAFVKGLRMVLDRGDHEQDSGCLLR